MARQEGSTFMGRAGAIIKTRLPLACVPFQHLPLDVARPCQMPVLDFDTRLLSFQKCEPTNTVLCELANIRYSAVDAQNGLRQWSMYDRRKLAKAMFETQT